MLWTQIWKRSWLFGSTFTLTDQTQSAIWSLWQITAKNAVYSWIIRSHRAKYVLTYSSHWKMNTFEEIMIFILIIYELNFRLNLVNKLLMNYLLSSENHDESFQSSCEFFDEFESWKHLVWIELYIHIWLESFFSYRLMRELRTAAAKRQILPLKLLGLWPLI